MKQSAGVIIVAVLICSGLLMRAAISNDVAPPPQLPGFDGWCANPRLPEHLVSLPYGYPTHLAASDLDGDGAAEILIATQKIISDSGDWISHLVLLEAPLSGNPLTQVLATAEGGQTEWGVTALRQGFVSQISAVDLNGDGLDDVAVVVQIATDDSAVFNSYLLLILGSVTGDFEILEIPLNLGFFLTASILTVDLDQSGEMVVIVPDPLNGTLLFLQSFNSGHFEFTTTISLQAPGFVPLQIVNADIDNDGDTDLVLGGFELESDGLTQRSVRIAERTGEMEFSVGFPLKVGWAEPSLLGISVAVTDVDGNGWLDILVTARSDVETGVNEQTPSWSEAETIFVLSQSEPGLFFSRLLSWEAQGGPVSIEWVVSDPSSTRIVAHVPGSGCNLIEEDLGSSSGGAGRECIIPLSHSEAALLADVDGDSWLDIVLASRGSGSITDLWMSTSPLPTGDFD